MEADVVDFDVQHVIRAEVNVYLDVGIFVYCVVLQHGHLLWGIGMHRKRVRGEKSRCASEDRGVALLFLPFRCERLEDTQGLIHAASDIQVVNNLILHDALWVDDKQPVPPMKKSP